MRARLRCNWQQVEERWEMQCAAAAPAGASMMDATGTQQFPPDPNEVTVEVWRVSQAWLDSCEAAQPGCVLWSEEEPD